MDKLLDSNNKLKIIVSNQSALIKQVLDDSHIQSIHPIQVKLSELQDNVQNEEIIMCINSLVIHTEFVLFELHVNLDELINTIILGKQGIINPQVVKPQQFLETFDKIIKTHFLYNHIQPTLENFQTLLDISNLKLWINNGKIVYTIITPILDDTEWKITKIYPIPSKREKIFVAPVTPNFNQYRTTLGQINNQIDQFKSNTESKT
ncbi:uncharacterized protein LOC123987932 [Osmia bicornis bicornis]|uniref:uncharacterized protein LOC123987932 n=1 Tax=Osmia bicornis bicornis TaxID=1437191 RepID=UPI001EAECCF6|nr:uncharacterized protein LOC123987932 [Osmia bicornis bicornis]